MDELVRLRPTSVPYPTISPPSPAQLAAYLPAECLPAGRGELLGRACRSSAPEHLVTALRQLPRDERHYHSLDEVCAALRELAWARPA